MKEYVVASTGGQPTGWEWDSPAWRGARAIEVARFRPESSDHRPRTLVRALHDPDGIRVLFRVEDRYVRCVHTEHNSRVCEDSCVELFVRPLPDKGYFNFEANCGGTLHCSYVTDWRRTAEGPVGCTLIGPEACARIDVGHTAPRVIDPEHEGPMTWTLGLFVPFELLERYAGPLGPVAGASWRANFYKCADASTHPHWAAWSPVHELNFHAPDDFGLVSFE